MNAPPAETRRAELHRIVRFAIVGVAVAAVYAILFFLFREIGLARWVSSVLAFGSAVAFQYLAQTVFTFRASLNAQGQLPRFLVTIGFGLAISTLITSIVGPALDWPEAISVLVVTVVLPVTNFLLFRLWVYRAENGTG